MIREPLQIDPETSEKGISAVFEERLSTIIEALGGPTKVAERFGVGRESVWKWRKGKARPSLFNVAEMCAESGYSIDWLMGLQSPADERLINLPVLQESAEGVVAGEQFLPVSRVLVGVEMFGHYGISDGVAALMTASGDAMHPTIPDGTSVVINTAEDQLRDGCIYVLAREGKAVIKRIQVTAAGDYVLISDNPKYERERLSASDRNGLTIVGQVVLSFHHLAT